MDYANYVEELLHYSVLMRKGSGRIIQNNIAEISHGELAVLLFLIDKSDGASAIEISEHFEINTSRVAAILNDLTRKGYAIRLPHPEDKRKIRVLATEEGKTFGEAKKAENVELIATLFRSLGEEDTREFIRIIKRASEIAQDLFEIGHFPVLKMTK